jgi:hypothetical protein
VFRISDYFDGTIYGNTSTSNPGLPAAMSTRARDPVFKRGNKRDSSQFPILKDEKQWDNWQRTTVAHARTQDVAEVFDPTYTPATAEDKAQFKKKLTYMFAVFEKTLLTDHGKAYIREHEKLGDAQSIETFVSMLSSPLKSLSTPPRCSRTSRPANSVKAPYGTGLRLVLFCTGRIKFVYTKVRSKSPTISLRDKKNMLQNAIHPVQELRAVKAQADQSKTQSGTDLTYDQYVSLLLSTASTYDAQFVPKTRSGARPPRRSVYSHEITESNVDDGYLVYDIESTLDVIQAHAHSSATARPPGTSMAFSQ